MVWKKIKSENTESPVYSCLHHKNSRIYIKRCGRQGSTTNDVNVRVNNVARVNGTVFRNFLLLSPRIAFGGESLVHSH